jgi:hypothetical protein
MQPDGSSGSLRCLLLPSDNFREDPHMKISSSSVVSGVLALLAAMSLTGCVVHDREVVHDGGYNQGYKEGYYDSGHNRYWHDQAWHDCVEHDEHCH